MENEILENQYLIQKELGKGSFGVIYEVHDIKHNKHLAAKIINPNCSASEYKNEVAALKILKKVKGFPRFESCGKIGSQKYILMELLEKNLQELFFLNKKQFTLELIVNLAIQIVKRVSSMHKRKLLHRDLKPHQFLLGKKNPECLYLVDFGLSRQYCTESGIHVKFTEKNAFRGTAIYASLNTHLGINESRRDDLESMCYIFSFLLNGRLPWIELTKYDPQVRLIEIKTKSTSNILFEGCPVEFSHVFEYVKSLRFEEKPDYLYIVRKLKEIRAENSFGKRLIFSSKSFRIRKSNFKNPKNSKERVKKEEVVKVKKLEEKESKTGFEIEYSEMEETKEAEEGPRFNWNDFECNVGHFQFELE